MKLNEFNSDIITTSKKALKENYQVPFNVQTLDKSTTHAMLKKVRGLISETRQSPNFYEKSYGSAYMKLVFMEQALSNNFVKLQNQPTRIVVENEEVEKSQVVLAAQDMVDTIQKMLEDVGQMQVKELPALVSSIESEIGVNESQTYNDQVTQQLDALNIALKQAFDGMKSALNVVTGQDVSTEAFDSEMDMSADLGMDDGAELDVSADMDTEEIPAPDEELEKPNNVGRAKR